MSESYKKTKPVSQSVILFFRHVSAVSTSSRSFFYKCITFEDDI
jgi:hypothetical protein